MRTLLIVGVCFACMSCSQSESFNRGYVISKTHLEPEQEAPSNEEIELHH